jgi:YD repeat-containing protein
MTVRFFERQQVIATVPHIARVGSVYAWAMDPGTAPISQLDRDDVALAQATAAGDPAAADLARLQLMATRYFRAYNQARDQIPGIFHSRRLIDPSEALLSCELNVTRIGGAALSGRRDTVLLDVGRTLTTPFAIDGAATNRAHQKLLLGHEGSFLEHRTPAAFHGPHEYSAVRFVQDAAGQGMPVYTVAADQVGSVLPLLSISADVKRAIETKAKPGRTLRLPATTITPAQYRPIYAFISYDARTGGAEYSLNGVVDGGGGPVGAAPSGNGSGNPTCSSCNNNAGSTLILGRGNYTHDETDLTLPARGIPIAYSRTYHSYFPTGGGNLGTGWIHSYADHIRRTPTGLLYVSEAGEWAYDSDGAGGYLEPAGFQGRITEDAAGFTFQHRDGRADYFDPDGKLTSQTDLNGNLVSLQYAADGRLATVTDTTGRIVLTFSYDVAG